jgi:hypothetical protein
MPAVTTIKLRRDTAADWTTADPILGAGELGIETDTNRIKIGDGATEWTGLPYGPVSDNLHIRVKNASASVAIPAGTLVQFAGAAGDTVTAAPAVTDGSVDYHYLIGITASEIVGDGFGDVVTDGAIEGLNTSAYTLGALLYSNPATAGALTATEPVAPNFKSPVAAVTRVGSGTSGRILVRMALGDKLSDLHDVTISSIATGELLKWDGTKWINNTLAEAGVAPLASPTFTGTVVGAPAEPDVIGNTAKNFGYVGLPQVILSTGNLTLTKAHAGEHVYVTGASQTITIPANGTTAFEIGTTIVIINANVTSSVAITTDTLRLAGTATTGTRTLAAYGMATLVKVAATTWMISGNGLT